MIKIIGHRGLPEYFPENTLLSFEQALEAGADAIECDIQMSACGLPLLFHDDSLQRVCGVDKKIFHLNRIDLNNYSAHEETRFGHQFFPTRIGLLSELSDVLVRHNDAILFAEIKEESYVAYSREKILAAVVKALSDVLDQVVLISYDLDVLKLARAYYSMRVGWVLGRYDLDSQDLARKNKPDFLFCNVEKLPESALWQGPWQWAVYDIVDKHQALYLSKRGIHWIESWNAADLLHELMQEEV